MMMQGEQRTVGVISGKTGNILVAWNELVAAKINCSEEGILIFSNALE
jgi:hypothetical protein